MKSNCCQEPILSVCSSCGDICDAMPETALLPEGLPDFDETQDVLMQFEIAMRYFVGDHPDFWELEKCWEVVEKHVKEIRDESNERATGDDDMLTKSENIDTSEKHVDDVNKGTRFEGMAAVEVYLLGYKDAVVATNSIHSSLKHNPDTITVTLSREDFDIMGSWIMSSPWFALTSKANHNIQELAGSKWRHELDALNSDGTPKLPEEP